MNDAHIKLTANIKAAGCAAKISSAQLQQIVSGLSEQNVPQLLTTIRSFEDAAVYKLSDDVAIVNTVDFFPPVVDDPFLFGRISAVNALSDVYAMGGQPLVALSILCFPVCDYSLAVAAQIVNGAASAVQESGAVLAGGHSIQASEPIFGLAVTGTINPQNMLTNGGARDGDALVLTKRIGTGALLLAWKGGMIDGAEQQLLVDSLTQLNGKALSIAKKFQLNAATDVTGFGLIGHLHEMSKGAGLHARVIARQVPLFPSALSLAEQGLVPAGAYANRTSYETIVYIDDGIDLPMADLLFDPQTSGGLLFALPSQQAQKLCDELRSAGLVGEIIGNVAAGEPGKVEVI